MNIEFAERRARRSDPLTSHKAAAKADRFASSHAGRILAVFETWRSQHMPAYAIAEFSGLTVVQVCRRLPEMTELEVVKDAAGNEVEMRGFRLWKLRAV